MDTNKTQVSNNLNNLYNDSANKIQQMIESGAVKPTNGLADFRKALADALATSILFSEINEADLSSLEKMTAFENKGKDIANQLMTLPGFFEISNKIISNPDSLVDYRRNGKSVYEDINKNAVSEDVRKWFDGFKADLKAKGINTADPVSSALIESFGLIKGTDIDAEDSNIVMVDNPIGNFKENIDNRTVQEKENGLFDIADGRSLIDYKNGTSIDNLTNDDINQLYNLAKNHQLRFIQTDMNTAANFYFPHVGNDGSYVSLKLNQLDERADAKDIFPDLSPKEAQKAKNSLTEFIRAENTDHLDSEEKYNLLSNEYLARKKYRSDILKTYFENPSRFDDEESIKSFEKATRLHDGVFSDVYGYAENYSEYKHYENLYPTITAELQKMVKDNIYSFMSLETDDEDNIDSVMSLEKAVNEGYIRINGETFKPKTNDFVAEMLGVIHQAQEKGAEVGLYAPYSDNPLCTLEINPSTKNIEVCDEYRRLLFNSVGTKLSRLNDLLDRYETLSEQERNRIPDALAEVYAAEQLLEGYDKTTFSNENDRRNYISDDNFSLAVSEMKAKPGFRYRLDAQLEGKGLGPKYVKDQISNPSRELENFNIDMDDYDQKQRWFEGLKNDLEKRGIDINDPMSVAMLRVDFVSNDENPITGTHLPFSEGIQSPSKSDPQKMIMTKRTFISNDIEESVLELNINSMRERFPKGIAGLSMDQINILQGSAQNGVLHIANLNGDTKNKDLVIFNPDGEFGYVTVDSTKPIDINSASTLLPGMKQSRVEKFINYHNSFTEASNENYNKLTLAGKLNQQKAQIYTDLQLNDYFKHPDKYKSSDSVWQSTRDLMANADNPGKYFSDTVKAVDADRRLESNLKTEIDNINKREDISWGLKTFETRIAEMKNHFSMLLAGHDPSPDSKQNYTEWLTGAVYDMLAAEYMRDMASGMNEQMQLDFASWDNFNDYVDSLQANPNISEAVNDYIKAMNDKISEGTKLDPIDVANKAVKTVGKVAEQKLIGRESKQSRQTELENALEREMYRTLAKNLLDEYTVALSTEGRKKYTSDAAVSELMSELKDSPEIVESVKEFVNANKNNTELKNSLKEVSLKDFDKKLRGFAEKNRDNVKQNIKDKREAKLNESKKEKTKLKEKTTQDMRKATTSANSVSRMSVGGPH